MKNDPPKIQDGFVAFFDIMGFSKMLASNEPEEINTTIRDVFLRIPGKINFDRIHLRNYELDTGYIVFSDSILVYQDVKRPVPGIFDETVADCFISYCCQLTADLLLAGLPVRGAVSKGKFSIIEGKSFTGKCIAEAYELAERLQLAACAVVPVVELEFLARGDKVKEFFQKDLFHWPTPVKNSPKQKLMLLNYAHLFRKTKQISRATLIECFRMHKKDITLEVLPKIENTLDFLKECLKKRAR